MMIDTLCGLFRKIAVSRTSIITVARYSTQSSCLTCNTGSRQYETTQSIKFIPKTLNIDFGMPASGNLIKNIIQTPTIKIPPLQEPVKPLSIQYDFPIQEKSVDLPTNGIIIDKLAVNMLKLRRRKMKKHKRRKLQKKMKFIWEKLRIKREQKKEKMFQAELIAKVKEAQAFDAKEYVNERLTILNKTFEPRTFRGEILPPEMIKQLRAKKYERKEKLRNKPRLTL
ncbi:hypothetical protein PUN28_009545 [Cardiocondyla obscurior]|uniref:Ribosomal protein mS38 C-terminal domain-containing protein n=1 Tax=Cardiocondyla obscurior TaxID=286306 RepID=A0AAW2FU42_9HYME